MAYLRGLEQRLVRQKGDYDYYRPVCIQEEETKEEVLRWDVQILCTAPLPTWNCLKEPPVVLWGKLGPVGGGRGEHSEHPTEMKGVYHCHTTAWCCS